MKKINPRGLVLNLCALGQQDGCVVFAYIAEHYYELALSNGSPLAYTDVTGHKQFWEEVAEAAKVSGFSPSTPVQAPTGFGTSPKVTPRPRWDRSCPDCGHEHEDRTECKKYLGEGKFCQCESRATA